MYIYNIVVGCIYCDILMKLVCDEDGMIVGFLEIFDCISYVLVDLKINKMIG